MLVLGLDLSYTSTGMVLWNGETVPAWDNVKTSSSVQRERRIQSIVTAVMQMCDDWEPDLVMLEDYAFSKVQGATMMGELGGVVKHHLWTEEYVWDKVQPMVVKAYAGSGKFDKKEMIAAAREHWPECPGISDVADAYWIARWGHANIDTFLTT